MEIKMRHNAIAATDVVSGDEASHLRAFGQQALEM
jgi:hypothetical protein